MIYNKKREKNEIINIGADKDKDIEGYVNIYNEIVDDKLEFVNGISELFDNAIEKKKFRNLKDDVSKLIGNSCICDVKKKAVRKIIKKKIVMFKEKAVRKIIKKKIVMLKEKVVRKIIIKKKIVMITKMLMIIIMIIMIMIMIAKMIMIMTMIMII